jgi:16S rRNA U1498 N3-methylase RsmE
MTKIEICERDAKHLARVLLKTTAGDTMTVSDGDGLKFMFSIRANKRRLLVGTEITKKS